MAKRPAVPEDTWGAFVYLVGQCASGAANELIRDGKTATQARNAIIGAFLSMSAGEACRIAREEGREPDAAKWRKATGDAFKRAVKRTNQQREGV